MKAVLACVLGSFLVVTVFGGGDRPMPPKPTTTTTTTTTTPAPTPPVKCGCNMIATSCFPCNPICNEPPRACPLYCVEDDRFCVCKNGFSLPNENSTFCIPTAKCRKRRRTCPLN